MRASEKERFIQKRYNYFTHSQIQQRTIKLVKGIAFSADELEFRLRY